MPATKGEEGQILIVLAIGGLVLILFMGLAVDAGMAYITKAKLSKSVDAACLTGMKALPQGQPTATTLATHIFNANYGPNPPVPTITFPLNGYGDQQVKVTATANVPTFFAQHFFQFWHVSDTAVATRGKLVMSLILDRSGSMNNNGGGTALKAAVPTFVNDWDNAKDELAMVSYASHARVDFHMATNFKTSITNLVSGWNSSTFSGGTFGTGGTFVANNGPPLALADHEIGSVPILTGENVTRVAIYFTDGLMNTIQDTFTCYTNSSGAKVTPLLNYGGYDTGTNEVDVFDPASGTNWCPTANQGHGYCIVDSNGNPITGAIAYKSSGAACQNPWGTYVTKFPSQHYGLQTINRANVTTDAQYRAIQTANAMRAEDPGVFIYVIGLGSQINGSQSTKNFLGQLANDKNYPGYNSTLPEGQLFIVPDCPGTTCTQELNTAFQTIAAKILLRLTQ